MLLHFERVLSRKLGLLGRGLDVLQVGAVCEVDDEDYGRGGEEGVEAERRDEFDDDARGGGPGEVGERSPEEVLPPHLPDGVAAL